MTPYYTLGVALARVLFTAFARLEVEGKEAVPPAGPLIVVSNHLSNADPPFLVVSVPRKLHFLGKRGLFANPIAAHVMRGVGVYPVSRSGADIDAIRRELDLLKRDRAIFLFPEGTRSQGGGMNKGHTGAAYIASKSNAPILPVGITGTEKITKWWRMPVPLCRIGVNIGEPFTLPVMEGRLTKPLLQSLTDMIMNRIAPLLPREYRGYYAEPSVERRG